MRDAPPATKADFDRLFDEDRRIENLTFTDVDGGVIAYFAEDRPFAVAAVLRDAWNYSVAVQIYKRDDGTSGPQGAS